MRFRSWSELLPVALAAAVEGIWAGALAAALSGASGPALMGFAVAVVFAAALLARRVAGGEVAGGEATGGEAARKGAGVEGSEGKGSRGEGSGLKARALAAALTLVAAGALLIVGHGWARPASLWLIAADVAYAAVLVVLGLALGGEPLVPEAAVSRAVRGFALLCAILAGARLMGGSAPAWAGVAVVVTLLAGCLLVAATRYEALTALVPSAGRAPVWPWLLAVVGVVASVVVAGVLVGQVLRIDVLLWLLAAVGGVLRYVVEALGFAVALIGAGLIRAIGGVLSLFHVHFVRAPKPPHGPALHVLAHRTVTHTRSWVVPRVVATVVGVALAIGVPLALTLVALRRVRRKPSEEVVEERETIVTLRSAAGGAAARAGRRLRRFATRRAAPRTPAELVRRRYEELEGRLLRAGHPRSPGTTVRAFLRAVWAEEPGGAAPDAGAASDVAGNRGTASPPHAGAALDLAADLAAIYELARYSSHTVGDPAARRFETLAAAFGVSATKPSA